jgi:hypothetical protein
MTDPKKYRDEAEHLRKEAEGIADSTQQRMVRKLAELYERLANYTEKARGAVENS